MLTPVGPLRSRVYWRRRVGVLLVLAALAGGIWYGIGLARGVAHLPWSTARATASTAAPAGVRVLPMGSTAEVSAATTSARVSSTVPFPAASAGSIPALTAASRSQAISPLVAATGS